MITDDDRQAALETYIESLSVDCELRGVNEVNRLRVDIVAQAIANARESGERAGAAKEKAHWLRVARSRNTQYVTTEEFEDDPRRSP
jgi:hypothetical protein